MRKNKRNRTPSAATIVKTLLAHDWDYTKGASKSAHGSVARAAIKKARKALPEHPANECFSENGRSVYLSNEFNETVLVPLQTNVAPKALYHIERITGLDFNS
ncbi:MAG: hypothetical protein AAF182_04185 [Pseudomonadota bacterium]